VWVPRMSVTQIVIVSVAYVICGIGVAVFGVWRDWTPFETENEIRPGFLLMLVFWPFFLVVYGGWGLLDRVTSWIP